MAAGYTLRPATLGDVAAIKACIDASYGHYVERIGWLPGPMTDDYAKIGYVEYDRRVDDGLPRVYMRKRL